MGSRADNHDGSCTEILTGKHAGKWRVQFIHVDEFGRKNRLSRLFSDKTTAKNFLQGLRRGERIEAAQQKRVLTLGGWFDWLVANDWPETIADQTIGFRLGRFNRYVRSDWGEVPLTKLDPIAIKGFYRKLRTDGVGAATVLEIKRDLVRVFNQAIRPYHRVPWTVGNPFALTVATPPRRDAIALTPEEARKALRCAELDSSRRTMLAVFLLAGLRLSEQMALTRGQILFDQDLILVDRAVKVDRKGHQTVGLPKGDKIRCAVICPTLKDLLWQICRDLEPSDHLWPALSANQPRMKKLVYATWRTVCKDANLPDTMSPHDCRLSHINWIEKLMPEVSTSTLKEHVGHAALGVTEVNYTRPLTAARTILRDSLERLVGTTTVPGNRVSRRLGNQAPSVPGPVLSDQAQVRRTNTGRSPSPVPAYGRRRPTGRR